MAYQYELHLIFSTSLDDEKVKWTDEKIGQLRLYVLKKTLASIKDGRTSLHIRTEAIEWLMDDSIQPFSYFTCCIEAGLNPQILRDLIVGSIKR